MFMRMLQLNLNPKFVEDFKEFYKNTISPKLQETGGCLFATLIKGDPRENEFISLTFWETKQHAETYEQSGLFKSLFNQAKPFFEETTEWKIQLTDDMELRNAPASIDPVIKRYSVAVQKEAGDVMLNKKMFIRIASIKIEKEKLEEFKKLFAEIIIPAFLTTEGCRDIFLTQSITEDRDFISISIWDDKRYAVRFEQSIEFKNLNDKIKDTYSKIYLWRMSLEKEYQSTIKTSDDMIVGHYDVVIGQKFS